RPVLRVRHGARGIRRAAHGVVRQRAQPGLGPLGLMRPWYGRRNGVGKGVPTMTADETAAGTPGPPEPAQHAPNRNLALELARVTEAAAMAAARWVGRGDKNGADGAAVNAMRTLINSVSMRGVVVIGEGEKDHAPMLFNGEEVGDGTGPAV